MKRFLRFGTIAALLLPLGARPQMLPRAPRYVRLATIAQQPDSVHVRARWQASTPSASVSGYAIRAKSGTLIVTDSTRLLADSLWLPRADADRAWDVCVWAYGPRGTSPDACRAITVPGRPLPAPSAPGGLVVEIVGRDSVPPDTILPPPDTVPPDTLPQPPPAGASPHYAHASFGGVDYIIHYLPAAERAQHYDWVASHYDAVIGGTTSEYVSRNPTLMDAAYDLIWTVDGSRQTGYESCLTAHGYGLETGYVHKAGTSATAANRITGSAQGTQSMVVNPGSAGFLVCLQDRARSLTSSGAASVFYDVTSSWDIRQLLPGASLEYPTVDAWYAKLYDALRAVAAVVPAKVVYPNTANQYSAYDAALADAAGGTFMEWANDPNAETGYASWVFIKARLAAGTRVIFAPRREAQYINQPYPNTTGQAETIYGSVRERLLVNEYVNYLMNVDAAHRLVLSLYTAAVGVTDYQACPHSCRWLAAFGVNLGNPTGAASVVASGTDGAGQPYQAFGRAFANGYVVYRPMQNWARTNFGNATAVDIALPTGTWKQLMPDASVRAAVSIIRLRNGEAAIFVRG